MRHRLLLIASTLTGLTSITSANPAAVLDITKPQPKGQTHIWSPLFQASWDKLKGDHEGKLIKIVPPNPLIQQLERFEWQEKSVMPPDGYAVFSGPDTLEFHQKVANEMRQRFNMELTPRNNPHRPDSNVYYGVLSRDLVFKKQFYRSKKKPLAFTDSSRLTHSVQFFGTAGRNSEGYEKNVRILYNKPEKQSFILTINTRTEKEQIIIFKPESNLPFSHAINKVLEAKKQPCTGKYGDVTYPYILKDEIIKIPYVTIDTNTDLTRKLAGKRFYEGDPRPWSVSWAFQITKFKLTEKGARIRLQTGMDDAIGGSPDPRKFICDRPFFIFTWRDGAKLPYFAAWIDGKHTLTPFNP